MAHSQDQMEGLDSINRSVLGQEGKLRRSQRAHLPTEASLQHKEEQTEKAEQAFNKAYSTFKTLLVRTRDQLRGELTEEDLYELIQDVEAACNRVTRTYEDLRQHVPKVRDFTSYQRRVDAATACMQDMVIHLHYRTTEIGVREFNVDTEIENLKFLKKPYAASVYSAVASSAHQSECGKSIKDLAVEAAADLASKRARVRSLQTQERERDELAQLATEMAKINKVIEARQRKLKLLEAQQELDESDARFRALNSPLGEIDDAVVDTEAISEEDPHLQVPHNSVLNPLAHTFDMPSQKVTVSRAADANQLSNINLATALADAVNRNRLPVPTPKVFTGNPLEFVSFKKSFKTLIENKGITAEEKIYYLQQYVASDAKEAISGCFYGTEESDYQQAWITLERRFGHPFKIQEAFRDKLDKWPRIGPKDGIALQRYADFLQACLDATPHVKDLVILNDCKENQRMAAKLPDWAITRWGRIVSDSIDVHSYPSFKQFVAFVEKEARVACHPIASVSAVKGVGVSPEPKTHVEVKGKSTRSLAIDQGKSSSKESAKPKDKLTKGKKSCSFCKGEHYLPDCSKFAESSIEERNNFVLQEKRCFGCLRTGHFTKQCKVRHTCQKCKGRHPTVLHDEAKVKAPSHETPPLNVQGTSSLSTNQGHANTTNVLPVWVSTISNPKEERLVYALLDTQSDGTFIEESVVNDLSVTADPVKLKLSTLLGKDVTVECKRVTGLRIRGYTSAHYIDMPAMYTRDFIPLNREHIPTCETAKAWFHLADIISEMPPLLNCDVGLLIGYNCSAALAPRQVIVGNDCQPYAVKTDLGWSIVGGSAQANSTDVTGICNRVSITECPPVKPHDVLKVFESDFKDTNYEDVSTSQEDIQFLKIVRDGVMMNEKGHLEMPLPFKTRPVMSDNHSVAVKRLMQLKARFDRNDRYKLQYTQFIESMLNADYAEPAIKPANEGEVHYIPHHGVYHPKKPDKLRVVFDCSARYQGESLNDHLLSGPDLTNNLFGVLCRFRKHPVAVICDIEAMFHQFHVSETDRDYLRFLWWEGGDTSKHPREFRMNVHLFGAASSPGCANFGLKHLPELFEGQYPLAAPFLCHDFYVDDGVTSRSSVEEAVGLINESRELCAKGKLRLHKFMSNSRSVLENIPLSERASEVQVDDLNGVKLPVERILGMLWNVESDAFMFDAPEIRSASTRRGVLSVVASIYDPVGLISPFILTGKTILQELCKRGTSWDEPISEGLLPRWESWKADMRNLKEIHISRCYLPWSFSSTTRVELHHFSDASSNGYGACSYLRFRNGSQVHCSLVASKARVAPIKIVTIPRLELTAAVIAVKLSLKLKEELKLVIDEEYFWCDSKIVLAYLNNDAKRFHVFVANRVQFVRNHTKPEQWQYVPSEDNPADHASRGLGVNELLTSNWFPGPTFLHSPEVVTHVRREAELMPEDPEIKLQAFSVQTKESNEFLLLLSRYSNWSLVTRIIARILRLAHPKIGCPVLTVGEVNHASLRVIKLAQETAFKNERLALGRSGEVPRTSKLYSLNPCIVDGVIRVGGRLKNSSLLIDQKHPVLLPREGHVTNLIIDHYHREIHHQGRGQTLHHIRSNGYWIISGSAAVAAHIKNCVYCRKLRRPVEEQKMADLPRDRVEPSPPFSFCGMDCFGPFITKQGRKEFKRYGLLFTCLCSRAVHIEMIEDMTTDSFIIGLRNFIAIRGAVTQIRSDRGSNFVGANNEFTAALKNVNEHRLAEFLANKQCEFNFNAPHSSHAGGVWERQIRSVRNVLNATLSLSNNRLDDASLRCLLYEAMTIINSRPLTAVENEPGVEVLTPNHLITMKPHLPLPPPGRFVKEDVYARKRWRRIQYLSEQFWNKWRKEYILNLTERQRWNRPRKNVRVGDIVMLADAETHRMQWPVAIVTEAVASEDGIVRRVKVRLSNSSLDRNGKPLREASVLERPIQKIIVLVEADTK